MTATHGSSVATKRKGRTSMARPCNWWSTGPISATKMSELTQPHYPEGPAILTADNEQTMCVDRTVGACAG